MIRHKAFCSTRFGQVYYWTLGDGPPLLLLHQASQSSDECLALAAQLSNRFRIISLDYPGHGCSDDPEEEPGIEVFAEVSIAVLDALGVDRVHVGGHHSGGLLSLYLAVEHASRISSATLSGIGIRSERGVRAVLERPMTRDIELDASGRFVRKTWQTYRRLSSPETPLDVTWQFFIVGLAARSRPFDAHFAMLRWQRDAYPARVSQPVLLLCGEHDEFAERPEELAEQMASCRVVEIPDGGAFLFYEQPERCAAEITRFIMGL